MNEYKNLHAIVLKEGSKGSSAYLREEAKDGGAFTLKYYEAASMSETGRGPRARALRPPDRTKA